MKTNEEVKLECINALELLIQNIKDDETSYNYVFETKLLDQDVFLDSVTRVVRYSVIRNEYFKNK